MIEALHILSILCCFVAGDKLNDATKIDAYSSIDTIKAPPNTSNLNESELTILSYVDRLDCGVQKSWKGNEFTESCHSLKRMGVNITGYYLLSNKSISFCDMSKIVEG